MRALREVRAQLPAEQYDRQYDLARGAVALVLAAAPQGAPDPAKYGIDAEALAKDFAERFGLDLDRAKAIVARIVSELSTQAFFEEAVPKAKPGVGDENAAELSRPAGDAVGSLSVVQTMRKLTGDASWGQHLLGSQGGAPPSASSATPKPPPKVLDLRGFKGRNVTERAMTALLEQSQGRRWSFDDLHEQACEMIRLARAGGAEVLS